MTLIQDVRVDRGLTLARKHLAKHLGSLAVFDRNSAAEILRFDAEAGRLDAAVGSAIPPGSAKQVWREAIDAAARGVATREQKAVAAKSLESFRAFATDNMHMLKSSRSAVRSGLRRALQRCFMSAEPLLRKLADEVEISYKEWCAKWGVTADPCTLAAELRALAGKGWQWDAAIGSSPLADGAEVRRLLEAAAQ